jgi:hypothetical protein
MGFTIEDMLIVSADKYQMKMVAGEKGWSNSISWLLMLEDLTIIQNFSGKELAVTTGLGFQTEEKMLDLVRELSWHNAAGLIVNTGYYIREIPEEVRRLCDRYDLPLLTVPWEVYLADMIKDMSIRIFLQSSTDEQISAALIQAIESPGFRDLYEKELLPHFDLDGTFQTALVTTGNLDSMDTVERKRIAYRMQLYLTNLTHNGHFFYYDGYFVIVMNAILEEDAAQILEEFSNRLQRKMRDRTVCIGVSDPARDISSLAVLFRRAKAATAMARTTGRPLQFFAEMGLYRLLYMVDDSALLRSFAGEALRPLVDYDRAHDAEYVETLEMYLRYSGSIKAMSEAMFIHRNTILYRMTNIKKILGCSLETAEERLIYSVACMIRKMDLPEEISVR